MINAGKQINDEIDFEDYCSEVILEGFIESLLDNPLYVIPCEPDDDGLWVYTPRACRLIDRLIDRLHKVGEDHFPDIEYFTIGSHLYRELD